MPEDKPHPNETTGKDTLPLVPVRELFDKIPKPLKLVAENVFTEIEKIHHLPQVSKIDLVQVNADSFDGEFEYYKTGRGIRIKISSRAVNKEFALLHEIGHFIDNQALGATGVNESEVADGALCDVLKAINETELIRKLYKMQKTGKYELMGRMRKLDYEGKQILEYLLRPKEQWARAYCQYIVVKSQNSLFAKQLEWERSSDDILSKQWFENDFENVIFAIDKLLIRSKWSKPV